MAETYRVIVKLATEQRGRAYIRSVTQQGKRGIVRQRPGLGSAPAWSRADAEALAAAIRAEFPSVTATISKA